MRQRAKPAARSCHWCTVNVAIAASNCLSANGSFSATASTAALSPADRWATSFGRAQLIYRMENGYLAASERRTDGQAVGF